MKFREILDTVKNDKRLLILCATIVLVALGTGYLMYYNSEGQIIARLARQNPRGGEFLKTIADSELALERVNIKPQEKIDALLAMAVAKTALGDKQGAVNDYKEILKMNVAHTLSHTNLASLYLSMGQYSNAEYEYLAVIATQPQIQDSYLGLADLYQSYMKNKENLIPAVLAYAIDRNGQKPVYLERLIQYYYDKGLYAQALQEVDQLLQVDPGSQFGKSILADIQKKS